MPAHPTKRTGYLPSLDGWRAIAILAVLAIHEVPLTVRGVSVERWQRYGSLGVVLFFAISGVLISGRILEEEALTGRFHLKSFYVRRLFRIQPAAMAYLAVVGLLTLVGVLHEYLKYWCGAMFLYQNFLYRLTVDNEMQGYFTGHFWTLAVEEHFYLLISLGLFFIKRRRALIFGGLLVGIKVGQMIAVHVMVHNSTEPLLRRTYWQMHMLLWPAVAAMLLRDERVRRWVVRWMRPWLVFLLTTVAALVAWQRSPDLLTNVLSYSFTLWVVATMLHPQSWTTCALEWGPLKFMGRISYSIYLWHVLFFSAIAQPPVDSKVLLYLSGWPWKYVCTLVAAVLSYYLIEKPFIRMGHKLAPPATAGHKDLNDLPVMEREPVAAMG